MDNYNTDYNPAVYSECKNVGSGYSSLLPPPAVLLKEALDLETILRKLRRTVEIRRLVGDAAGNSTGILKIK